MCIRHFYVVGLLNTKIPIWNLLHKYFQVTNNYLKLWKPTKLPNIQKVI